MRRLLKRIHDIPHLFAKVTVVYCIAFASAASVYALYKQGHGMSMGEVLAIVLGFFGGELLFLCLKTILDNKNKEESKNESSFERQSI